MSQESRPQYPSNDQIEKRAQRIWKMRVKAGKSGTPTEDWQRAIEELQVELQSSRWERFWRWTGISEKKGWELMTGLSIPLLIFVGGSLFTFLNSQQQQKIADQNRKQDLEIADEKQKDDVLKNYFDTMRSLLLDKDKPLRKSKEGDESRSIARTLTLTTLRQLGSSTGREIAGSNGRKGLIIQFLYESNLIGKKSEKTSTLPIIDLNRANLFGANLRGADLRGADLRGTNLFGANLRGADLRGTNLRGANLFGANLFGADLNRANLSGADLRGADLSGTELSGAYLIYTDLRNTLNLTQQQLEGSDAPLLCNVALPENLEEKPHSINPNRDCDRMAQRLVERYPDDFPTLQKAQEYVNEAKQKKWDQE